MLLLMYPAPQSWLPVHMQQPDRGHPALPTWLPASSCTVLLPVEEGIPQAPMPTRRPQTRKEEANEMSITDLVGIVMILGCGFRARRLMRIRYCVILVSRCLFLCTRNFGQ